jgi:hypothetical protein
VAEDTAVSPGNESAVLEGPAKLAKIDARASRSAATQKLMVENGDVDVAINITPGSHRHI